MEIEDKLRKLTEESLNNLNEVLHTKSCAGLSLVACLECPLHIHNMCLLHMVSNEVERRRILSECSLSELIAEIRRRPNITEVRTNGS